MDTAERLKTWTPAQVAALVFGVWWIGNGLAVFFAAPDVPGGLAADSAVDVGGLSIAVNGWHGVFHLSTGMLGLVVCTRERGSRAYAAAMAVVYITAAFAFVVAGPMVFGFVRVDSPGSIDHAIEGVLFALVWIASRRGRDS